MRSQMHRQQMTLAQFISKEALKWCLKGFLIACAISTPLVVYYVKQYVEKQTVGISHAAVKAFRTKILSGNIRFSEEELKSAFQLADDERLVVRTPDLALMHPYNKTEGDWDLLCTIPNQVCWSKSLRLISYLAPIYFDSEQKELYGYLEYVGHPSLDPWLIFSLFMLLGGSFLFISMGLFYRLRRSSEFLSAQIVDWSLHMKNNPRGYFKNSHLPIAELEDFNKTLSHLDGVITQLESDAENRGKNTIIRGLAHDLLKPTSQIQKWFYALKKSIEVNGTNVDQTILNEMQGSLNRLIEYAKVIKALRTDLESVSKIKDEKTDVDSMVLEVTNAFNSDPEMKKRRIRVAAQNSKEQTSLIQMSPENFRRVLENLIKNAVDASSNNAEVKIQSAVRDSKLELQIVDTGLGMNEQTQKQIFDLDFTTKPLSGTGLGLPIVKQICESHGGQISFQSAEGKGTTFNLSFDII